MARMTKKEREALAEAQRRRALWDSWDAALNEIHGSSGVLIFDDLPLDTPPEEPSPFDVEEEEVSPFRQQVGEALLRDQAPTISPFLSREALDTAKSFLGTVLRGGGALIDALAPDPHPLALGEEDHEQSLPIDTYARSIRESLADVGAATPVVIANLAERVGIPREVAVPVWFGDSTGAEAAARSREIGDAIAAREEAGLISAEELRQRELPNRVADALYGAADRVQQSVSPELKAAQERLGEAVEEGTGAMFRQLTSPEGARALFTGVLPMSAGYAAQGFGTSAVLRGVGAAPQLAASSANMGLAYTIAQQNADEAEQSILSLSPEEALLNPIIREEFERTGDIEGAKRHAARMSRHATIAASVPMAPLYNLDVFSRAGAGMAAPATATLQRQIGTSLLREGVGEFAQEAGESIAADLGGVAAGAAGVEDIGRTALASGTLGALASAPLAGGMSYAQASSDFARRADRLEEAADRIEAALAQADEIDVEQANEQLRPDVSRADPEESVSLDREPIRPESLRTVEENAAAEAAGLALSGIPAATQPTTAPAEVRTLSADEQEILNRRLLALEPENEAEMEAWRTLMSVPTGRDLENRPLRDEGGRFTGERFGDNLNQLARDERGRLQGGTVRDRMRPRRASEEELTAEAQRIADTLVAEQQEEASAIDAQITRDRQLQEAREFDQQEQERGDAEARKRLAAARGDHTRRRRAHLASVREANLHLDADARAEAIADAAAKWDAANPRPTLDTLPPEAPRARGRRPAARPTRAPRPGAARAPAAPEAVVEAPVEEEAPAAQPIGEERMAELRARYGRAQEDSGEASGRSAAEVTRELAARVRRGTDSTALASEALLSSGKLSIVDPDVMASVEGANENTEGYYDGERMYINAAQLPAGDPVGVLFNSVLAHEANHAATISQNPDAVSKVSVLLDEAPRQRLIEQLETATHPTAVAAREAVAARNIDRASDPARYEDELVAYAINHAIESSGRSWAPIRGLVSAARAKFKEFVGSDNINLNDLAHYANATIGALAESEAGINAPGVEGREQRDLRELARQHKAIRDAAQGREITPFEQRRLDQLSEEYSALFRANAARWPANAPRSFSAEGLVASNSPEANTAYDGSYPLLPGTLVSFFNRNAEGGRSVGRVVSVANAALASESPRYNYRLEYERDGVSRQMNVQASAIKEIITDVSDVSPFVGREQVSPEVAAMQAEAEQMAQDSGLATAQAMVEGTPTRTAENVMLPVDLLQNIPGTIDEARGPGDSQYDGLLAAVETDGWRNEFPIDVRVNHRGEAYIVDGNTRVAVAAARGLESVPANVQWMNGAENVDSPLTPAVVESFAEPEFEGRAQEAVPDAVEEAKVRPYVAKTPSRLLTAAKDAFTVHGSIGENAGRMMQEANYARDAVYQTAIHRYHRVGPAMNAAADKATAGEEGSVRERRERFNDMILKRLENIAQLPTESAKDKALARLVQEYPDLAPLSDAIQDINKMTDTIISARFAYEDTSPLTNEEQQLYDYMDRNKYGYFTNIYAAFQGKDGREYVEAVMNAGAQGMKALAEGKEVPPKLKRLYQVYDDALRFIMENDVAVSDPEMLAAMSLKDVSALYDRWMPDDMRAADLAQELRNSNGGQLDTDSFKAIMEERIAEHVDMLKDPDYVTDNGTTGSEILHNHANAVMRALLENQPLSGPAARYAKARGIDTTILEHRANLPEAIANLYGQIRDIPSLINATLTRQGELASRLNFFNRMATEGYGDMVVSASDRHLRGNENFTVPLSGPSFGRLNGMYTTPEMAQRLADYNTMFTDLVDTIAIVGVNPTMARRWAEHRLGSAWTTGAGIQKAMKIITRPDYHLLNLVGSFSSPVLAGGVKPAHLLTGMKVALEHVALQIDPKGRAIGPELSAAHQLALQTGAFDSAVVQELRRAPRKLVNRLLEEMTTVDTVGGAMNVLKKAGRWSNDRGWQTLVEAYTMMDTWVKLPILLERMDYLESYYKANGDNITRDQLVQEAARFMRDATISMDNVPGLAKFMERSGLSFYLPYFASVFRVLHKSNVHFADSVRMAVNARTPEAKWIAGKDAARKAAGIGVVWATAIEGLKYITELGMDDEDKEQMERDRELMFDEAKYGDLRYLGINDQGHRQYFLSSRTDQFGPAFDIARGMRRADSMDEALKMIPKGMWDLFVANRLIGATIEHVARGGRNTQLERTFPTATTWFKEQADRLPKGQESMDYLFTVLDTMTPAGIMNYFDPRNKTPIETQDDAAAIISSIAAVTGHRLITVNPEAALRGKSFELRDHRRDANRRIREAVQNLGPRAGFRAFLAEAEKERSLTEELGRMYYSRIDSGMSRQEVESLLEGLDSVTIRNLRNRAYTSERNRWAKEWSGLLSMNSINNPPEFSDLPPEERQEAQEEWRRQAIEVNKLLNALNIEEKR